jgi:predicted O-linked N-acetylglucosamine transferase (SPINDLY family)
MPNPADILATYRNVSVAIQLYKAGTIGKAMELCRTILAGDPRNTSALHILGLASLKAGDPAAALAALRQAIALQPLPDYLNSLGNVHRALGETDAAVEAYRQALALRPGSPETNYNLGNALAEAGRDRDAVEAFGTALRFRPRYAEAQVNLGNALARLGRLKEAEAALTDAVTANPRLPEAHANLGNVLKEAGRLDDAIAAYRTALSLRADYPVCLSNLGNALTEAGRADAAVPLFREAIRLKPDFVEAQVNLGLALTRLSFQAEAIAAFRAALRLRPDHADAQCNIGLILLDLGRDEAAAAAFAAALAQEPGHVQALRGQAAILRIRRRFREAVETFDRHLAAIPDGGPGRITAGFERLHLRRQLCDWDGLDADTAACLEAAARGTEVVPPFALLGLDVTPDRQRDFARRAATAMADAAPPASPLPPRPPRPAGDRLRIGYVSADFQEHPTAYLAAEVFERHDRGRFEIIAYSCGEDDGGPMRARLMAGFDRFVDLGVHDHRGGAGLIAADGIDILIDLKGYTARNRLAMFAHRPAPIQAAWLGFPGTTGADFIDYLIADAFVVPPDRHGSFTENIVTLPETYQPNDSRRAIAAEAGSRTDWGLPETGFVFCCFNNSFKISPEVFAAWMRLLAAMPGSVLWLLETNDAVAANLRREAAARGIAPERLVMAPRIDPAPHLARHRLADLFLDTWPYGAHTTASDALWAGLPVLTCAGDGFASRVAGSLLQAVGLPELITTTGADYEAMALDLARSPERLGELRARLARNRATAPLFDSARFTRHLEAAYEHMAALHAAGAAPQPFAVAARP